MKLLPVRAESPRRALGLLQRPVHGLDEGVAAVIGEGESIRQLLDQPGADEIEFEPPRFGAGLFRTPDLA